MICTVINICILLFLPQVYSDYKPKTPENYDFYEEVEMNNIHANFKKVVQLTIMAKNLANKDYLSKSDPQCFVKQKEQSGINEKEIGQTEVVQNNLNPVWHEKILIEYYFEKKQELIFQIYDIDFKKRERDFIGEVIITLGELMNSKNGEALPLKKHGRDKKTKGQITIIAEEQKNPHIQKGTAFFKIAGRKLKAMDRSGYSDPYLEFYQVEKNFDPSFKEIRIDGLTLYHRQAPFFTTHKIKQNLNPVFPFLQFPINSLKNGDQKRQILIKCVDYERIGKNQLIGFTVVTLAYLENELFLARIFNDEVAKMKYHISGYNNLEEFRTESEKGSLFNMHEVKRELYDSSGKSTGTLLFTAAGVREPFHFVHYITSGMQIEFGVAIDYTGSSQRLHILTPGFPNQYETAIQSVLEVCTQYNPSQLFQPTGFGAEIPAHPSFETGEKATSSKKISEIFPLNWFETKSNKTYGIDNWYVNGVEAVLNAYKAVLPQITLHTPTTFAPTIKAFTAKAKKFYANAQLPQYKYQILLIITDGVINDMQATKNAIVEASNYPISIIIIGVGNADFRQMDELDNDHGKSLESSEKQEAKHDIVQFVSIEEVKTKMKKMIAAEKNAKHKQSIEFDQSLMGSLMRQFGQSDKIDEGIFIKLLLREEVLKEVPMQVTNFMKHNNIVPAVPAHFCPPGENQWNTCYYPQIPDANPPTITLY